MITVDESLRFADQQYTNQSFAGVLAAEVRRLREENERLRNDAAVGAAIQRAAKELPVGDMIEVTVENGSVVVVIYYDCGGWDTMDVDAENRLDSEINAAIDAARGAK